jgi:hypothetical protein
MTHQASGGELHVDAEVTLGVAPTYNKITFANTTLIHGSRVTTGSSTIEATQEGVYWARCHIEVSMGTGGPSKAGTAGFKWQRGFGAVLADIHAYNLFNCKIVTLGDWHTVSSATIVELTAGQQLVVLGRYTSGYPVASKARAIGTMLEMEWLGDST